MELVLAQIDAENGDGVLLMNGHGHTLTEAVLRWAMIKEGQTIPLGRRALCQGIRVKYAFMRDHRREFPVRSMCRVLRVHPSGFYAWLRKHLSDRAIGVVATEGKLVKKLVEKLVHTFFVNAGVYLLNPDLHGEIPEGRSFDMTDLIEKLVAEGRRVVTFPVVEYWIDIGHQGDYERVQEDVKNGVMTRGPLRDSA